MFPLIHLNTIDSTQAFLSRHPELGFCGVMADAQTAGRGRGSNSWESASGAGLWLSARLPLASHPAGTILQQAMAAAIEALAPCKIQLGLKWPNDLVAYRQDKSSKTLVKIGGIIGEQKENAVTFGLGLNIYSAPQMPERAIPPASLSSLGASEIPQTVDLAKQILIAWQNLKPDNPIDFRWPDSGDKIQWEEGSGICQGWEPDGRLAVLTKSGIELLTSGDIATSENAVSVKLF